MKAKFISVMFIFIFIIILAGQNSPDEAKKPDKISLNVVEVFADSRKEIAAARVTGYVDDLGDKGLFLFFTREHADFGLTEYGILLRPGNLEPGKVVIPVKKWLTVTGRLTWGRDGDFDGFVNYIPTLEVSEHDSP